MERLTKYGDTSHENGVCCTHFNSKECNEVLGNCAYGCKWEEEAWSKLASYEDAEEQGLLLRLPCKVGDAVYLVDFEEKDYDEATVRSIEIDTKDNRILINSDYEVGTCAFDSYVFYTKAEAEKALEEMGE